MENKNGSRVLSRNFPTIITFHFNLIKVVCMHEDQNQFEEFCVCVRQ
jgi:hypothetical protein